MISVIPLPPLPLFFQLADKMHTDVTSFVKAHLVSDPPKSRAARFPRFSPDGSILVSFFIHAATESKNKIKIARKQRPMMFDVLGILGCGEHDNAQRWREVAQSKYSFLSSSPILLILFYVADRLANEINVTCGGGAGHGGPTSNERGVPWPLSSCSSPPLFSG